MSHLQAPKLPFSGMALLDSPRPNPPAITIHSGSSSVQDESTPSLLLIFIHSCSEWYVWIPNLMSAPSVCSLLGSESSWISWIRMLIQICAATLLHGRRMEIKLGVVCEAFASLCSASLSFHCKYPFWNLKCLSRQMWPDWGLAERAVFRIQQKVQVF